MAEDASYSPFAKKIMEKDREIRQKMEAAHGESGVLYELYKERLAIYTEAEKMPIDPVTKVLFSSMKSDVVLEIALFKLRKDFDEQASQIISRIDNMENDIKTIKKKLNINQN
jgi:uncharacterized protein (UPF0335 family)